MLSRNKWRWPGALSAALPTLLLTVCCAMFATAEDAKPATPTTPQPGSPAAAAAKEAADKAAAAAAAAAPAAPSVPDYFSGSNDPKAPKWPDPSGGNAGVGINPGFSPKGFDGKTPAGDVPADMKTTDLYDRIAHNAFSINMMWVLITGFLVMFMQTGFALVEAGLCRAKNAAHTMGMNFMIYPLGCIAFYVYGFALGWGNWFNGPVAPGWYSLLGPGTSVLNSGIGIGGHGDGTFTYGLMGTKGFCLMGVDDVSVMGLFFFMMVFMDTTATIPTGVMAERWGWKNFLAYGLWVALPYCLYANWLWGGGWLAQMGINWKLGHGAVDFAGSGVVHAMGGVIGLVGGYIIGPRIGKFVDGKPQAIPGHHVPMVVAGTFILAFGWFGFNPGSTLAGTDLRTSFVVVNTMLAGIVGALTAAMTLSAKGMKHDPTMLCNGMLAGLVAITAPCAFVSPWAAVVIGGVAGMLVILGVFFWENRGIDDPAGAVSVHGVNGVWGVISLGLFANGDYGSGWNGVEGTVKGLFYGDSGQLIAQCISALTVVVFGGAMAFVWFKVSNLVFPLRVPSQVEIEGLDIHEVGAKGYPDFVLHNDK